MSGTRKFLPVFQQSSKKKEAAQRAKKVVSDSPGLVDFAIGLVNSVLNLPDWQVNYFEEFNLQKNCEINYAHQKIWGLLEMTFGLEWQAVKLTFFAPCGTFHNSK